MNQPILDPVMLGQGASEFSIKGNPGLIVAPVAGLVAGATLFFGLAEGAFGNVLYQGLLGAAIGGGAGALFVVIATMFNDPRVPTQFDTLFGAMMMLTGMSIGVVSALAQNREAA